MTDFDVLVLTLGGAFWGCLAIGLCLIVVSFTRVLLWGKGTKKKWRRLMRKATGPVSAELRDRIADLLFEVAQGDVECSLVAYDAETDKWTIRVPTDTDFSLWIVSDGKPYPKVKVLLRDEEPATWDSGILKRGAGHWSRTLRRSADACDALGKWYETQRRIEEGLGLVEAAARKPKGE